MNFGNKKPPDHNFQLHPLALLCSFLCVLVACAEPKPKATTQSGKFVESAREQIGVVTIYDPAYVSLSYPGGDISPERGVCTDVVIRALRLMGADLQKLVHEDMKKHFSSYPKRWGLKRPDKNIDHRRVPNLRTYFKRRGLSLPVTEEKGDYLPGDIVTCLVAGNRPHIVIISDEKDQFGTPKIIHNIGSGTVEERGLFNYKLTGHYRWFKN